VDKANDQASERVDVVFAILGDPHFALESGNGSHLKIKTSGDLASERPNQNPWAGLYELIHKESLSADAVLCPGDIAFQSNKETLKAGWRHLVDLGRRLKAEHVISATGNHDISSRSNAKLVLEDPIANLKAGYGLFETLKLLDPPYPAFNLIDTNPTIGHEQRVRYFGSGLLLVQAERYQILIVNSCCEHGHDAIEYQRGTFPESAVTELTRALKECANGKINVAVMHHPPAPHAQAGAGAHDFMDNGHELLQQLAANGDWLVIHGHKHEAKLEYAAGSAFQPIIFGAASLAIFLEEIKGTVKNQFYLLKMSVDKNGLKGHFRVWDWNQGRGWQLANPEDDGIYDGATFGTRDSNKVASDIVALAPLPMAWAEVLERVPDAGYLPPAARNLLRNRLRTTHGRDIEVGSDGQWTQLLKVAP
jgi:metallophosphoesterase superfamily enzyme